MFSPVQITLVVLFVLLLLGLLAAVVLLTVRLRRTGEVGARDFGTRDFGTRDFGTGSVDTAPADTVASAERSAAAEAQARAAAQDQVRAEQARASAAADESARSTLDQALARAETDAHSLLGRARQAAERESADLLRVARRSAAEETERLTEAVRAQNADVARREHRLSEREERLDALHRSQQQRDAELAEAERAQAEQQAALDGRTGDHARELERIAGLTAADAKSELLAALEGQIKRESGLLIRDLETEAREQGDARARNIVADAIARVASEQTSESVVSVLHLPSDEMKGRIIGREGRNIRTFESVTGVNLIIDDTPEAVLLSCFDPVRREVGRLTLEKLVLDGRIHPHRIEEVHERCREEVDALCVRAGEDAILEVGIGEVHRELITHLGRLKYRTSYGQNVLKHLIETAHIAGLMAAELRMDARVVKRAAFLHDIGKALTHEVEGSHAIVGADLARRYGESDEVAHAIEAHHNEVAPQTIEAVLTQASDSCSGGRPGARRESLETYVKRLERIEEIASTRPGVDKVFAMQAGREIRVMVSPDQVDDIAAHVLARDVAKQIEDELTYPGQIRVTVVRETRSTEIAH